MKNFITAAVVTALSGLFCISNAQETINPADSVGAKYKALWNDDLNKEIDERIEKYRKADGSFYIESAAPGTEVRVEQRSHSFLFGAHIFNFDQLGSESLNAKYKDLYREDGLFNSATVAFYWKGFEPKPGKTRFYADEQDSAEFWNTVKDPYDQPQWRRPSPEKILDFLEKRKVVMHGHTMIYLRVVPEWVPKDAEKMGRLFNKRIDELTSFYKGRLASWDVVNESVHPDPGKKRYEIEPNDYTFVSWKRAEKGLPAKVDLCINDSWRPVYPPFIKSLIERGAKIDIVGLQMHIFGNAPMTKIINGDDCVTNGTSWKPRDVEGYLRELDLLKRPIHLSEITIPAPGRDAKALAQQAQLTIDMYRLWFSWPSIYRITWWNVVDDCGWKGEPTTSGLFTRQMDPKPVYFALDHLINKEWKTNIKVKTDQSGKISFRGFKGKYHLHWTAKDGSPRVKDVVLQ